MAKYDLADKRILMLLQHDARLTTKEIADKLGKSVTAVYERIRRLEKEGYISGYVAILNRELIEKRLVAFANVQLKEHAHLMLKDFEKSVVKLAEVMECHHMTGSYDYLLKIVVDDMGAYHDFILNKLAKLANIGTVQSSFIMTEVKYGTAYHLQ
ncbi:MAG: Lrp/AsnC family transcriptional regulator [Chitinophagaceae bacterium]|nr:Lrp/AsnC family transcriptional regulator [Chitinophagaceae bacterium]